MSKIPKKDRAFIEVYGGYYDEDGFYNTPNGSKQLYLYEVFGIMMAFILTD